MRIALSTYSTKPRGGVVHTLALGEALARAGHDVTLWALARGGDTGFFRPVSADAAHATVGRALAAAHTWDAAASKHLELYRRGPSGD